jgi:hypothetical protein
MKPKLSSSRPTLVSKVILAWVSRDNSDRSPRRDNAGITLVELLVSILMGSIVLGITFAGVLINRRFFLEDVNRTDVQQNVRAALDLTGLDVRQIGENLGTVTGFPAMQITRETPTGDSIMIIRRNPVVPLRVCENPTNPTDPVVVALQLTFTPPGDLTPTERSNPANAAAVAAYDASLQPNCTATADRNGNNWPDDNIEKWINYRENSTPPTVAPNPRLANAYIFNGTNAGENFSYSDEDIITTNLTIAGSGRSLTVKRFTLSRSSGSWPTNPVRQFLYIVEERQYELVGNTLQVVVNGVTADPINLVNGLSQFQVTVNRQPTLTGNTIPEDFCWRNPNATGATVLVTPIPAAPNTCGTNNTWPSIQSIDVTVSAASTVQGQVASDRTQTKRYFPRSVSSF